jgi:predicted DNA binding CopG/RHH family protein
MNKRIPEMTSDDQAEAFLDQDLSDIDFSQFKPIRFEFQPKTGRVTMRFPESLLAAVKAVAAAQGIPYQRYIRHAVEEAVVGAQHDRP